MPAIKPLIRRRLKINGQKEWTFTSECFALLNQYLEVSNIKTRLFLATAPSYGFVVTINYLGGGGVCYNKVKISSKNI